MFVEQASSALVTQQMKIDRFVADRELALAPQIACDLLRAEVLFDQLLDALQLSWREASSVSRSPPTAAGHTDGVEANIAATVRIGVAFEFPGDSRS